ncbi:hypothetical protein BD626DRAFT_578733 [Schizophyllum amplum]|uniref:Uncharacterized protein n=1 Tax=Schizophyllum amplum TaxID=97359 RepID=A0A550BRU2_9AGAR|nr:hypothetical protein BD626DRAFT_578733 [Auriculariopsis ampla]
MPAVLVCGARDGPLVCGLCEHANVAPLLVPDENEIRGPAAIDLGAAVNKLFDGGGVTGYWDKGAVFPRGSRYEGSPEPFCDVCGCGSTHLAHCGKCERYVCLENCFRAFNWPAEVMQAACDEASFVCPKCFGEKEEYTVTLWEEFYNCVPPGGTFTTISPAVHWKLQGLQGLARTPLSTHLLRRGAACACSFPGVVGKHDVLRPSGRSAWARRPRDLVFDDLHTDQGRQEYRQKLLVFLSQGVHSGNHRMVWSFTACYNIQGRGLVVGGDDSRSYVAPVEESMAVLLPPWVVDAIHQRIGENNLLFIYAAGGVSEKATDDGLPPVRAFWAASHLRNALFIITPEHTAFQWGQLSSFVSLLARDMVEIAAPMATHVLHAAMNCPPMQHSPSFVFVMKDKAGSEAIRYYLAHDKVAWVYGNPVPVRCPYCLRVGTWREVKHLPSAPADMQKVISQQAKNSGKTGVWWSCAGEPCMKGTERTSYWTISPPHASRANGGWNNNGRAYIASDKYQVMKEGDQSPWMLPSTAMAFARQAPQPDPLGTAVG